MASSLGLSVKLSPEAIASLHSRKDQNKTAPVLNELDESTKSGDDEQAVSNMHPTLQDDDNEDWEETIAISPNFLNDTVDETSHASVKEDEKSVESNESKLSRTPPPSLPLVVVNLERLCGFAPSTEEEAHQLRQQVMSALSTDDDDNDATNDEHGDDTQQQEEHDSLSRHFDERVKELFENGVAHHSDTLNINDSTNNDLSVAVIQYPKFLCRNITNDGEDVQVLVTARAWKKLLQPHDISVVDKLLQYLSKCNQALSWKIDMHDELLKVIKNENEYRTAQQEDSQLLYWRTERRKTQLDKLYQVRETFDHQLQAAMEKLEILEQERNEQARVELRRLRLSNETSDAVGGLEALDFDTNHFFIDNHDDFNNAHGVTGSDAIDTESVGDDESASSNDSGYENEGDVNDVDDDVADADRFESFDNTIGDPLENSAVPPATVANSNKERARSRRKASQKARQRRLQSQQEAAKQQARIEQAIQQEEQICEACTTPELKMAQATVQSLEERMQQVDDLLESLQEEEWADEEEGITQSLAETNESASWGPSAQTTTVSADDSSNESSLLHSILAMILGTLPQANDMSQEEHYRFIRQEHHDIVTAWKDYFGRLPLPLDENAAAGSSSKTVDVGLRECNDKATEKPSNATELRESFGIVDNSTLDNWDDECAGDDVLGLLEAQSVPSGSSPTSMKAASTKQSVLGLRPGGRAMG